MLLRVANLVMDDNSVNPQSDLKRIYYSVTYISRLNTNDLYFLRRFSNSTICL